MEIGERDLDFCPALICCHLLDALPVSACAVYELERSFTVAAVRQDPKTDAVKSGPVCTAQVLGSTAISRTAVCNAVRIFQRSLAVFHVFLIQCQCQLVAVGILLIRHCNGSVIVIGFKVINDAPCSLFRFLAVNRQLDCGLVALGGQQLYRMGADLQLCQSVLCNGDGVFCHGVAVSRQICVIQL